MCMRIMLFGAAGQVGADCVPALRQKYTELLTLTRADIDFSDAHSVSSAVIHYKPHVIINACAYTAVDKAEDEWLLADQVNHLSVSALAKAADEVGSMLIHLSTDYVFDGKASLPYRENVPVNPIGIYGKTKSLGENAVLAYAQKHIILRTSWVFGEQGNNFVKTMLNLASQRDQLSVVSDQFGRPTYVSHIVDVIMQLIARYETDGVLPWGVYHCSSQGDTSWYTFACTIFDAALTEGLIHSVPKVSPITTEDYPTSAPRPEYSVLNTDKLEILLEAPMPSWRDGLRCYCKNMSST